ncbi:MAG: hypothetical protein FJY55_13225, partial [Betaproteobacteria bacterium]|nr:hypothetical protein [Betaproteobacteria bacterium]
MLPGPLPRGEYQSDRPAIGLWDHNGDPVPIQTQVISRFWADADQSIRLLKFTFICDGLPANGERWYKLRRGNPRWASLRADFQDTPMSLNDTAMIETRSTIVLNQRLYDRPADDRPGFRAVE